MAFNPNIPGYSTQGKSFSRTAAFPLESYEIWTDYDALVAYAANTDPNRDPSYIGQKVAYIDTENGKVTHYGIEIDGSLKELGVTPLGDGKSVEVSAEGVISLLGAANADSLTLPRMKEDKSGIEWVPVSQVVEGDGNDNTTYLFMPYIDPETSETTGFMVIPSFNGTPIEGGAFSIIFDFYSKKRIDEKLVSDIAIEKKDEVEYIILKNKDGDEVASVDASIFVQDSFLEDVDYNAETGEITFTWTMGDGSTKSDKIDVAAFVQTYTAGAGLKLKDNEFSVDTEVIATVASLESYAQKATTLAGYGITDAYTATQTDEAIAAKIREMTGGESAADVLLALNNYKASNDREVWGDEFVANHTSEGIYTPDYSGSSRIDTIKEKLDTVERGAEKNSTIKVNGIEVAPNDKDEINIPVPIISTVKVSDLLDGAALELAVEENTSDIAALEVQIHGGTVGDKTIPGLNARMAALEAEVGAVEASRIDSIEGILNGAGETKGLVAIVGEHTSEINTLKTYTLPNLGQAVINEETARKAADKHIRENIIGLPENSEALLENKTVLGLIEEVSQKVNNIDFTPYATNARVDTIYKAAEGDTPASGILATAVNNIANLGQSYSFLRADVDTLIGDVEGDGDKSVREIAAEETAKIVAGADTAYDTLKEIADFIMNDETGAAAMANDITALKTKVDIGDTTITAYVEGAIEAAAYQLPAATKDDFGGVKLSDEIGVDADDHLEIKSVSTDKLVQGKMELVLNGGNANGKASE